MEEQQLRRGPDKQTWLIIILSGLMVCTVLGFCNAPRSLYIQPITEALGVSRSVLSIYESFRFVATAGVNLIFGTLVVRFGPRKLIAAGFISLISSVLLCSVAENVFLFYVGGALLGLGIAWTTTTMVGYVVNLWCHEHKGTIMGAVLATSGIGAAIGTQILSPIITREGDALAYRDSYRLTALILLVVGTLVVLLYRDHPAGHVPAKAEEKREAAEENAAYAQLLQRPEFWVVLMCIFLTGMVLQGIQGVAAPHMRDEGLDAGFVATILSCQSLTLAVMKFSAGWLFDKKGLRFTAGLCMAAAVITTAVLIPITASGTGKVLAYLFAFFSAMAYPLETVMLPIYADSLFGQKAYHKVLGIFVSVNVAGYATGGPILNLCHDLLGDYRLAFAGSCLLMVLSLVAMQWGIARIRAQGEG